MASQMQSNLTLKTSVSAFIKSFLYGVSLLFLYGRGLSSLYIKNGGR